ncbi:MAG: WD40/YVTN/BNR-like repeat-containing protein, partial [Gemmatimonadaceae bacterium]
MPLSRAIPLIAAAALLAAGTTSAQTPFDKLQFRSIGPAALGGRIHDIEVPSGDPSTIYIGAASGGIWKSTNKGTTWTAIFDNQPVSTFGDIAIFHGDNKIVWAGTGEQNNRQSTSWGNGVYRSTDAGATWTHVGLEETRHI